MRPGRDSRAHLHDLGVLYLDGPPLVRGVLPAEPWALGLCGDKPALRACHRLHPGALDPAANPQGGHCHQLRTRPDLERHPGHRQLRDLPRRGSMIRATVLALAILLASAPAAQAEAEPGPWHYDIVSTVFWVGEYINADPDGSQEISAYDENWMANYGGCDGIVSSNGKCEFELRTSENGYFPL